MAFSRVIWIVLDSVGIGPLPEGREGKDFVLSAFARGERAAIDGVLRSGAEAVLAAASEGVEAAMNRYNPAEPTGQ